MEFLSALHYNRCEFKKGSVLLECGRRERIEKMEIVASILVFGILGYDLYGMMKNNIRK